MKIIGFIFLAALTALSFAEGPPLGERSEEKTAEGTKPVPPGQPKTGPGGSDYAHKGIRETQHGKGGGEFWIIEPERPSPAKAPLVIFLHGYSAMHPDSYRGWVNHLAKRGNIVVYPRYQEKLLTPATQYFPNVAASVRAALAVLGQSGHVAPDLERVAVVGHSAGGVEAANYATRAGSEKLPVPKAAMLVQPGQGAERGFKIIPLDEGEKFLAETHLLVVVGDIDRMVGTRCARTIWQETKQVRDRSFVTMQSDDHGVPELLANHLSPVSWSRDAIDALDWRGYWKMFDGLMDAAFAGKDCTVDVDMGTWSDGVPVKPLKVER